MCKKAIRLQLEQVKAVGIKQLVQMKAKSCLYKPVGTDQGHKAACIGKVVHVKT